MEKSDSEVLKSASAEATREMQPSLDGLVPTTKVPSRNNAYASFLIKKHGLFYRPYWSGYTKNELAAGRYTYEQAKAEIGIEPDNISMHTAPECKPQGIAAAILGLLTIE